MAIVFLYDTVSVALFYSTPPASIQSPCQGTNCTHFIPQSHCVCSGPSHLFCQPLTNHLSPVSLSYTSSSRCIAARRNFLKYKSLYIIMWFKNLSRRPPPFPSGSISDCLAGTQGPSAALSCLSRCISCSSF